MNLIFFSLYRYLLSPISITALPIAAVFNAKLREGLRLRRQRSEGFSLGARPVWIHAASGEFEYAKAVIRELKERYPSLPILVTYFSPSFAKAVTDFPGVDRAVPLPLDLPGSTRSFLRKMQPRALLIARTDLWPEMLEQCRKSAIPVVIFSYTQKPFKSGLKRLFTCWTLRWIQRIYSVSDDDRAQLTSLNLEQPIEVIGDTRYDQVAYRLSNPKPIAETLKPKDGVPCFVAGSTWAEDEAVLLPALAPFLREKKLKLVLVPHEPTPEHIENLQRECAKLDLSFTLFSKQSWHDENVLLVDKVGVLAELYLWGDYAFVGGSFRKSVHSVMEALGAGCITFVGPYHENNREAVQFHALMFEGLRGVQVVRDSAELTGRMQDLLINTERNSRFTSELHKEFAGRLGASRKLVEKLSDIIG